MHIAIKKYPFNKDCALAVTIDDLHPESNNDAENLDFGYDMNGTFWERIHALIEKVPQIGITLFTVANWIDRSDLPSGMFWPLRKLYRKRRSYAVDTFNLADKKYKPWIENINQKTAQGNIEISLHGLYHHNDDTRHSTSQEFAGLHEQETKERIKQMVTTFEDSHIRYEKGFRPPGWGTNEHLFKTLKDNDFLYVASNSDFITPVEENRSKKAGIKNQMLYDVNILEDNLLNFTANCYPHQTQRAVEIAKRQGIIVVHCHIAQTVFGLTYVDNFFVSNIERILREIKNQTLAHIWFATLAEMARFFSAQSQVTYKIINDNEALFTNHSKFDLHGLTISVNNQTHVIDTIPAQGTYHLVLSQLKKEPMSVTAVLTVYNGEKHVFESLQSLCDQTYRNLEIIVVNDGSTDKTAAVLEKYIQEHNDSRVRVLNQKNGGRSNARNNGFKLSRGELITFCEDDAKYDKDYIKNAVTYFEKKDPQLSGIIGPHYVWNKYESLTTRVKDIERRRNFTHYKPTSSWFYMRDVFTSVGCFNENLELVEDIEPAIKLAKQGYTFTYADNCRWLHKEPPRFFNYLRRKFRGGIGMALLQQTQLKPQIVPPLYILGGSLAIIITILLLLTQGIIITGLFILLGVIGLLVIRIPDILKVKPYSNESLVFMCLGIYIEYIWWISTLIGYFYGLTMKPSEINTYLKGR